MPMLCIKEIILKLVDRNFLEEDHRDVMRIQREQEASGEEKKRQQELIELNKRVPGERRQQRNPSSRKQKKMPDCSSPLIWMQSLLESLR